MIGLGYDLQGNLENKNGQAYSFDYGNRLREVAGKESYRYDSLGRRVQSTRQGGGYGLSMYGKSGQMLYSEDHGTPAKALEHIYLGNSLLATRQIDWANTPAIVRYQHTDALGSPVAVTNTAGPSSNAPTGSRTEPQSASRLITASAIPVMSWMAELG
ncbi:hypothetical protein [Lysobacter antibioticus]|uniref:RHS Repeat family protein n=1 Tax=Lysobacter antibioticus TaxID=84531 RepID=A0A0S2F504_LYSAN|nr:hypothetical protein [Lysobacter antibioticus]ALN78631.1 RHS Repeat family protein [Lysobacter antibioticus]